MKARAKKEDAGRLEANCDCAEWAAINWRTVDLRWFCVCIEFKQG